ncbi:MAG: hypothetical protein QXT63_04595 [Thermoplasmata archaeon]
MKKTTSIFWIGNLTFLMVILLGLQVSLMQTCSVQAQDTNGLVTETVNGGTSIFLSATKYDEEAYFVYRPYYGSVSIDVYKCTESMGYDIAVINENALYADITFGENKMYVAYVRAGETTHYSMMLAINTSNTWTFLDLFSLATATTYHPIALAVQGSNYHVIAWDYFQIRYVNNSNYETEIQAFMNSTPCEPDVVLYNGRPIFAYHDNNRLVIAKDFNINEHEGTFYYEYVPIIVDGINDTLPNSKVKMFIPSQGPDKDKWIIFYSLDNTNSIMCAVSTDEGNSWQLEKIADGTLLDVDTDNLGNYYIIGKK